PILALLIFGGATLKDFAFALLVGITSGAYSSIFIAAPLLTILKEREPEFARRKDVKVEGDGRAAEAVLEQAEEAAAAEPSPDLSPVDAIEHVVASAEEKRERRRQRRRARPHGRTRQAKRSSGPAAPARGGQGSRRRLHGAVARGRDGRRPGRRQADDAFPRGGARDTRRARRGRAQDRPARAPVAVARERPAAAFAADSVS